MREEFLSRCVLGIFALALEAGLPTDHPPTKAAAPQDKDDGGRGEMKTAVDVRFVRGHAGGEPMTVRDSGAWGTWECRRSAPME